MKRSLSLLFAALLVGTLGVSVSGCKKLPAFSVQTADGYTLYKNLPYVEDGDERHLLDLCVPDKPGKTGLLLYVHGGGWVAGEKDGYEQALRDHGRDGLISAALNYRYISAENSCTELLDDIDDALACIKAKLAEHGIDCTTVVLMGASAGAHLSLQYAYTRVDTAPVTPVAAVSLSGPTDFVGDAFFNDERFQEPTGIFRKWFSWLSGVTIKKGHERDAADALSAVSPLYAVTETSVPTIVCQGVNDDIVPYQNAVDLDARLTECGVPHHFLTFPNSGHGLENDPAMTEEMNRLVGQYLELYLK